MKSVKRIKVLKNNSIYLPGGVAYIIKKSLYMGLGTTSYVSAFEESTSSTATGKLTPSSSSDPLQAY